MTSRKWLSVFAVAAVLLIGWFVGMQTITTAQETKPLQRVPNSDKTLVNDIDLPAEKAPAIPGPMPTLQIPALPTAWEYKSGPYTDDTANALGKEGWELVDVYTRGYQNGEERAVFKRSIVPTDHPTPAEPSH